jgi:hypothetical protein
MISGLYVGGSGGGGGANKYEIKLVASNVTGVTDGNPIETIPDSSGNGNDAVQTSGALQAVWDEVDADFNNKSSIVFTDDWYEFKSVFPYDPIQGSCFWWVGSIDTGQRFDTFGTYLTSDYTSMTFFEDLGYLRYQGRVTSASGSDPLLNDASLDDAAVWLLRSDGTNFYLYKNGGSAVDTEAISSYNVGNSGFKFLGAFSSVVRANGKFAEIRVENAEDDLANINAIGSELATTYGFTWITIT